MKTEICRIDPANIDMDLIIKAGECIKQGGIVAFPTETVYGLGGDAFNKESSKKIYSAKGRPSDNPLIIHIADLADLKRIAINVSDDAIRLIDHFWPGPLTLIFEKTKEVPTETTGGLNTVAVRFPSDLVAQKFIKSSGGFVAAPSANISGKPSPTCGKYVVQDMDSRIDMILYGDDSNIGLESTIVDMTVDPPMILRPGFITKDDLLSVIDNISIDSTILSEADGVSPKAPGMKYRHYAPQGQVLIVSGADSEAVVSYINNSLLVDHKKNKKTGVIATDQTKDKYNADVVYSAGNINDKEQIAHRLFSILRAFDDENVEVIYSESFSDEGLGTAVMNRLLKAAGHNIINLSEVEK